MAPFAVIAGETPRDRVAWMGVNWLDGLGLSRRRQWAPGRRGV